jgi:hypothetical protein
MIPDPVVEEREPGVFVVRDDLLMGGTKRCYADQLIRGHREVVYASPAYGGAQIAIAWSARELGVAATIFVAKRKMPHPRTQEAFRAGAKVVQVPAGYLANVQAKARRYCEATGAFLLPFGLDVPEAFDAIAARAAVVAKITGWLDEVWSAAGSGVLSRGLQRGLNAGRFIAVQVGRKLGKAEVGNAKVRVYPADFAEDAWRKPPFPSCSNYDAKAWDLFDRYGKGRRLLWNVAR